MFFCPSIKFSNFNAMVVFQRVGICFDIKLSLMEQIFKNRNFTFLDTHTNSPTQTQLKKSNKIELSGRSKRSKRKVKGRVKRKIRRLSGKFSRNWDPFRLCPSHSLANAHYLHPQTHVSYIYLIIYYVIAPAL